MWYNNKVWYNTILKNKMLLYYKKYNNKVIKENIT
jgi:hypothetical protein